MPNVDPYVDQVMEVLSEATADPSEDDWADWRTRVRQTLVDAADHGAANREQLVEGLLASDHNIEIRNCIDCPFALSMKVGGWDTPNGTFCMYPNRRSRMTISSSVPDWCPLRERPSRVLLAEGV